MAKPEIGTLQVVDKVVQTWFVSTAAFRMQDPTTGHIFEPGVKYRMPQSEWMAGQPTITETDMDEDITEKVQVPQQPSGPRIEPEAEKK